MIRESYRLKIPEIASVVAGSQPRRPPRAVEKGSRRSSGDVRQAGGKAQPKRCAGDGKEAEGAETMTRGDRWGAEVTRRLITACQAVRRLPRQSNGLRG